MAVLPTRDETAKLLNQVRGLTSSPTINANSVSGFIANSQSVKFSLASTSGISTIDLLSSPYADVGSAKVAQSWNAGDANGGFSLATPNASPSGRLYFWVRLNPQGTSGTVVIVGSQSTAVTVGSVTAVVSSSGASTITVNDVTASRVANTTYQNTSGKGMAIAGTFPTPMGSSVGVIEVRIGPSSASLVAWKNQATATVAGGSAGFISPRFPNGWFYRVNVGGDVGPTPDSWLETTE